MKEEDKSQIDQLSTREFSFCERVSAMPLKERTLELTKLIRGRIAEALDLAEDEVGLDVPFASLKAEWEDSLKITRLLKDSIEEKLERSFYFYEFTPYPREDGPRDTIAKLATYLAEEMVIPAPETTFTNPHEGGTFAWKLPAPLPKEARQNPPAAFVLCSPRSGSTLMRFMLDSHPDLYCPPELFMLPFERMGERRRQIDQLGYFWTRWGLGRTLAQLEQISLEQARQRVEQFEADDVAIQEVYRLFQELIVERLLIDKTAMYSVHSTWLYRAEEMFEGAKYLHLIRHPCAVIESFVRLRFHGRLLGNHWGIWDENPWLYAEKTWAAIHHNTLQFLKEIDPDRYHLIRFEDLVTNPRLVMSQVCDFLDIPFNERVLHPFKDELIGVGDPNFKTRNQIDPTLATAWKKNRPPQQLSEFTRRIAAELGYNPLE